DHVGIFAAFHAGGRPDVIGQREAALGFVARHEPARAVAAAFETLGIAEPAHDERARAHAAGNDAEIALARAHRALARDQHGAAVVLFPGDVVVVAIDCGRGQ